MWQVGFMFDSPADGVDFVENLANGVGDGPGREAGCLCGDSLDVPQIVGFRKCYGCSSLGLLVAVPRELKAAEFCVFACGRAASVAVWVRVVDGGVIGLR
jgi:hypothetical protein